MGEAAASVHARSRAVTWQDPAAARQQAAGWTGLEIMRAIRDGLLPPPPMARLVGFDCVVAESGEITMTLPGGDQSLENLTGVLHGGVAATLLDTAMGARPISATGKVLNQGRGNIYVQGELRDGAGRLAAHAVGNFSVISVG